VVELPRPSPAAYRRITLVALVAVAFIIVTGAAVRLTGSGLGCPTWPSCEKGSLVPRGATGANGVVEFSNRMMTPIVSVVVILTLVGSIRRVPRRTDLIWLSISLVVGVLAQAVLGGISVLVDLDPVVIMAHFLLSIVLVWQAVLLHHRAGEPDTEPYPVVAPEVRAMGRVLIAATILVLVTGTVVTGSGPHGGDETAERLPFFVTDVARIHGIAENLFLLATLLTLWLLHRTAAPTVVRRRAQVLLGVLVAQAAVGYVQYFTGVPVLLVGIHVFGAVCVWIAVLHFHLGLWQRPEPDAFDPERGTLVQLA
jgi:cytochrome c oxidase assembly protein subunit 15